MKHVVATLAVMMLLMGIGPVCAWGAPDAGISGVVRDAHGTPQMGALVELLGPDATVIARAFTDDHGRYLLGAVLPGSYQLRASAAFLLPAVRGNVRLRGGARAVADLTLTAIFEVGSWLPAQTRSISEPADDWQWTLRSTANRPLLRLANNPQTAAPTGVSSSADHRQPVMSEGQVVLLGGDGSFGEGGAHQVITLDHTGVDGDVSVLRANVRDDALSGAGASFVLAAGVERQRPLGGGTRVFFSVESHPELQTANGGGLQLLRTATTDKMILGDTFVVDAGTLFTAERLLGTRVRSAPYVRVAFRPSSEISLEYRMASDRSLQRTEDLDEATLPEEGLSDAEGRPLLPTGLHQEIVATEAKESHNLSVAVYRDALPVQAVEGGGPADQMRGLPAVADPSTGTLRLALRGFTGNGVRVSWTQTLSPVISACVEGELGKALEADTSSVPVDEFSSSVHAHPAPALSASIRLHAKRTGTAVDVRYRWQPVRSLTQVDAFDASRGDAYLGVRLRQRLWSGRRLRDVNAVVEATNLLAQGYEPFLSPDGQMLFLAQVPRGVIGGLAFSF